VVQVELTPHLFSFFPDLKGREIQFEAATVRDLVSQLDELAPGLGFYLCDELGALRTHVNIFVGEERLVDRERLTDRLKSGTRVTVMQALSGG
jgi:sulfur-carrier protein